MKAPSAFSVGVFCASRSQKVAVAREWRANFFWDHHHGYLRCPQMRRTERARARFWTRADPSTEMARVTDKIRWARPCIPEFAACRTLPAKTGSDSMMDASRVN